MSGRGRRGAALATALFALVTIAVLARAVFAPAAANRRAAFRLAAHHRVESAAERAIAELVSSWPATAWRAIPVGAVRLETRPGGTATPLTVQVGIRRLTASLFSVDAEASLPGAQATVTGRRSVLLELPARRTTPLAGVTAGGDVELGADVTVRVDSLCGPDVPPAILATPSAAVTQGGAAMTAGVVRDPSAADAATYANPGGLDVSALAANADVILPAGASLAPMPVASNGVCVSGPANWGDPAGAAADPCRERLPVVRADGDVTLTGGRGQGILIAAGRVSIAGPFIYRGVVVASGGVTTSGSDVAITGAVITGPADGAEFGSVRTSIVASGCAVTSAAAATTAPRVVPVRGWGR